MQINKVHFSAPKCVKQQMVLLEINRHFDLQNLATHNWPYLFEKICNNFFDFNIFLNPLK